MAHPERFERPTLWFVARYSIQLSYGCEKDVNYREQAQSCQAPFYKKCRKMQKSVECGFAV